MLDLGLEVLFKGRNILRLLEGIGVVLKVSIISVAFSIVFGVLLGVLSKRNNKILNVIIRFYLEFMRIMPQMVLLFIVYFGTTKALGWYISGMSASLIAFSLWGIAEMSDLVSGAIDSLPAHQFESALALGLKERDVYLFVILPQVVRRLIPLSINLITRMVKTTSLMMMIGVVEILKVAQQIIEANRMSAPNAAFGVYLAVFLIYFLICWPIGILAKLFEKKNWVMLCQKQF